MHDLRAALKGTMPVLQVRPARGDEPPQGWTRVDDAGLEDARAEHAVEFQAWRDQNPPADPAKIPPPRVVLRSPDGTKWRLRVDNVGDVTARKVQS